MKLAKFLKKIKFTTMDEDIEKIQCSHPLQWINKEVQVPIWKIEYRYKTKNNKEKIHVKYIIKEEDMDVGEIEHYFKQYIEDYNNNHPYRALSNVEILDMQFIDGCILELE